VQGVRITAVAIILAAVFTHPLVLQAHHEAIFGPQSSLVLSADRFVSFQVFSRELGTSDVKSRETTTIVSAGLRLSKRRPLTFTAIVPYSWISAPGRARTSGTEDVVLGLRYRHDLKGLQEKWHREGNFLMGMGVLELNNGTIDHPAWTGPADSMGASLGSFEWGAWSAIGYGVARFNAENREGSKEGNTFFTGGGVAYTPNEDFQTGRLLSYQAGWSYEHYGYDRTSGEPDSTTGGAEVLLHPTFVYSPGHDLLFFAVVSFPVWRDFGVPGEGDRYRVGTGVLYTW
jgi:hypothetical protein